MGIEPWNPITITAFTGQRDHIVTKLIFNKTFHCFNLPLSPPFVQLGETILFSWEQKVSQVCKELLQSSPSSTAKGFNYMKNILVIE